MSKLNLKVILRKKNNKEQTNFPRKWEFATKMCPLNKKKVIQLEGILSNYEGLRSLAEEFLRRGVAKEESLIYQCNYLSVL